MKQDSCDTVIDNALELHTLLLKYVDIVNPSHKAGFFCFYSDVIDRLYVLCLVEVIGRSNSQAVNLFNSLPVEEFIHHYACILPYEVKGHNSKDYSQLAERFRQYETAWEWWREIIEKHYFYRPLSFTGSYRAPISVLAFYMESLTNPWTFKKGNKCKLPSWSRFMPMDFEDIRNFIESYPYATPNERELIYSQMYT